MCSAYIDLNPVRAKIVLKPEDYRWCSLGLRVRSPRRAKKFLYPLSILPDDQDPEETVKGLSLAPYVINKNTYDQFSIYRAFVYRTYGMARKGKTNMWPELVKDLAGYHGKLGINDHFRYRMRNISEGLAFGSYSFIALLQEGWKRKYISPRSFIKRKKNHACDWSFTTRVLHL
jgi:hypothetical protein